VYNSGIIKEVVAQTFLLKRQGNSTDDMIISNDLNESFIHACKEKLPNANDFELNWTLFNLRKQGKLGPLYIKRKPLNHDEYIHASEIAARFLYDKYRLSIDRIMCEPEHRSEFDLIASSIAPDISPYLLRKAALKLRKTRKLKPELVVRIADWNRSIQTFNCEHVLQDPICIPKNPGIYIFRDNTGYLYVGESENLQKRVAKHLDHSDRKSLAHYFWENDINEITLDLHIFDPNSDGRKKPYRRAYESDLIQSRNPRFNIQP
jgi:hypothetical protein